MTSGADQPSESQSRRSGRAGRPFAAPGASGPEDPAYEGGATLGDEGAAAGPESFVDPTGTEEDAEAAVSGEVRDRWARADRVEMNTETEG